MNLNPGIFKAYDVRGVYPSEIHEDAARAIGSAFVAYLNARHIAVGRDMRLSSPALAAAFIDGATSEGADVVDYGMIATDMLYFAVARDGHDGGALRRRAVDERAGQRRRGEAHVASDRDVLRVEIRDERRADGARAVLVDLTGIDTTDVVRLEDARIEIHSRL